MLTPDQLRQRYQARQQRLARDAEQRSAEDRLRQQETSASTVAAAIARAQARREKR